MGQGEHPSKLTQLWLGHRYGQITFLSDDDDYDVLRWAEHRWRLWLWSLNEWMDGRLLLLFYPAKREEYEVYYGRIGNGKCESCWMVLEMGMKNFPGGIILIPLVKYLTFWFRRQVNYLYELIGIIQINFSSENFTGQWKLWTIHSTYFISLCFVKKSTILAVLQI